MKLTLLLQVRMATLRTVSIYAQTEEDTLHLRLRESSVRISPQPPQPLCKDDGDNDDDSDNDDDGWHYAGTRPLPLLLDLLCAESGHGGAKLPT